jgi:hypothetical protein
MRGNGGMKAQHTLEQFPTALHQQVQQVGAHEVVVDIRELEFMNSSCLTDLVFWLSTVRDSPSAERTHIVFLSDPAGITGRSAACTASPASPPTSSTSRAKPPAR